jgi:predicted HTH transcriptional regulator
MEEQINPRELVESLRSKDTEEEWFEFKVNYTEPHKIGECLSALSNSAALSHEMFGYLIYGVDDSSHDIVGTDFQPRKSKGKGNEDLEPWLNRLLDPRVDCTIFEDEINGSRIVVFQIGAARERPVKFDGVAYIRVGSYNHKLADYSEKERKLWSIIRAVSFEEDITLTGQTSEDVLKKIDYPKFFELIKTPLPDNRAGILTRLEEEKIIQRVNDRYAITNLGAILFAKNLEDFPTLSRKSLRIVIYDGDGRLKAKKEHVVKSGYATSFESTIEWIHDQVPSNEVIKDALRIEQKMYPKIAIREIVANALIHQDFSITGAGPMVEVFQRRMEISNPGKPLISPDRFIDHPPRSRNEKLASMMRRMNICEERGSGIDRAIDCIEVFQLPAPEFLDDRDFMRVTLFGHQNIGEMGRVDKIRACYQHCCLRWVCRDYMTNTSLRKRLGINDENYPMASRIIKDTMDKGLIRLYDPENKSNRTRKYVPSWS